MKLLFVCLIISKKKKMLNFLELNSNLQNFFITSDFFIIATSYGCLIASAILTIVSVNPIHALINLITTFFTATIIIFLLNLIFFALILLAVYLGAIAVLFLFMIIMLDIKPTSEYSEIKSAWSFYEQLSFLIVIFFFDLKNKGIDILYYLQNKIETLSSYENNFELFSFDLDYISYFKTLSYQTQLSVIGNHLFTENIIAFVYNGILLFIGMVGAIVLTVESIKVKFLFQQDANQQSLRFTDITRIS